MALICGMSSSLFNNSLLGDMIMYSVIMYRTSWNNLWVFFTSVLLTEIPGIGIAGSKGECTCGFARSCLIPFHEGCAIFLFSLLLVWVFDSHQPFQQSTLLGFGIWDNPVVHQRLPRWLSDKEPTYRHKRHGFIPLVGKIPWRRKWQSTPVFCLENSMDREA